jgi:hypothetical protein
MNEDARRKFDPAHASRDQVIEAINAGEIDGLIAYYPANSESSEYFDVTVFGGDEYVQDLWAEERGERPELTLLEFQREILEGADLPKDVIERFLDGFQEPQAKNLYIYDGDSDGGQVIYDGLLAEHDDSHSDPALLTAIEKAKATPGKYVKGKDKEGCPFAVMVN